MHTNLKAWLVVALLLGTAVYAIAEDITLTTYYPSPRGVYQDLRVMGQLAIGTMDPSPSALLDLSSTQQGLLPPRMTEAERNGIASPAAGLVIYNTDASELELYNGTEWVPALTTTPCPAGYVDAGNYCIEASERAPATWWSATEICQSAGAHLCSMIEWYPACAAGLPGLIGMTGNNEWIGDMTYHGSYHASFLGSSGCATGSVTPPAAISFSFRCCTNKS